MGRSVSPGCASSASVLVVVGDAGLGKSALLGEAIGRARRRGNSSLIEEALNRIETAARSVAGAGR